jgi:hypothetical protein
MRRILLFICLPGLLSACTRHDIDSLAEDNGCIERIIVPATAHVINNADKAVVDALFQNNNIDNSNFRYLGYRHDSVQTDFPPFLKFDQKVVRVDQYTNGLRILGGDMAFKFKSDVFNFKSGYSTNGTYLNTTPHLSLSQVRKLFIDDIGRFDHNAAKYKDNCFKAEFGYYNLNAGVGYSIENLVKAWKVTPKDVVYPSEYPVGYYADDNGTRLYYFNGVQTFR